MGKITKKMQAKHKETQSPWLKAFVKSAVSTPLPLLPQVLADFPSRWPFPRGDLFHWIPLLNRFDNILECFVATYNLDKGPQTQEFASDLLLNVPVGLEYAGDGKTWNVDTLREAGFGQDGDRQLMEAVLGFTRMLLENCGNRSIYSSSAHLNHVLNTTSMSLLLATLRVGSELARRYQASLKRLGRNTPQQQVTAALLANHYNIDLDSVHQLAMPFVRTPIISLADTYPPAATPGSSSKGKEHAHPVSHAKNAATMYANDLVAVASSDAAQWNGWGDVKIVYYPQSAVGEARITGRPGHGLASTPGTPTPLRRSSSVHTPSPKAGRSQAVDDASPSPARGSGFGTEFGRSSAQKTFDVAEAAIKSTPLHVLMSQCPPDLPKASSYELLHRLRIAKALVGSKEDRQEALAVRLLAILNLINIHPEPVFTEKVLRHDIDETRRFQLAYQLADLIHPTANGSVPVPIPLQSIALSLLEALSGLNCRFADVVSALNATVNHGILLYVMRTAVAGMKEDEPVDVMNRLTDIDEWRSNLFSLASQLTANPGMKIGGEMLSSGLMDVLVEILGLRSNIAMRHHPAILQFLDTLIWTYSHGLEAFFSADGLDAVAKLTVVTVEDSCRLMKEGLGTGGDFHTSVIDYDIPFYHHQTLRSLLRFIHHIMSNWYSHGGNADRLLRNLADKSDLLQSLRTVIEQAKCFGSYPWTSASTILSDFINNDPTSFAAISESGLITAFLTAVTGRPVPPIQQDSSQTGEGNQSGSSDDQQDSPDSTDAPPVILDADDRPHPPTAEMLAAPQPSPTAGNTLPSFEAISIIPVVLNAICLNNSGLRMVVASRVFESYFEVFESPAHVRCLDSDYDSASGLGRHFDELARHHPALRTPIANAAIDMVARVCHLGKDKARIDKYGVKLQVLSTAQKPVQASKDIVADLGVSETPSGPQNVAPTDDSDIEMSDRAEAGNKTNGADDSSDSENDLPAFEPFVYALCNFLTTYLSNSNLKLAFINKGGIELLLDIAESPSLAYTFGEHPASRTLQHVISGLVEHTPVLALPSVLRRTQSAIDRLGPLAKGANGDDAYFAPFLQTDLVVTPAMAEKWTSDLAEKMAQGSDIARALLNAQTFVKTLCDCFAPSSRSNSFLLHPVNVFDYYVALIQSLGPLLRASLLEESAHHGLVPRHWSSNRRASTPGADDKDIVEGTAPATLPTSALGSAVDNAAGANSEQTPDLTASGASDQTLGPTQTEMSSIRFKNYDTLRLLLHSMMPTAYPLFQSLGKALLPRRDRDKLRPRHLDVAKALAESVLDYLEPSVNTTEPTSKDYHYWIIMMHTIHEMLIDTSRASERSSVQLVMPVLLAFKERGGFGVLNSMFRAFVRQISAASADGGEDSTKAKVASFGVKKILDLYVLIVNGKYITDSASQYNLQVRADRVRDTPLTQQLVVELRLLVLPVIDELWQSDLVETISDQTLILVVDILNLISTAEYETPSSSRGEKFQTSLFKTTRDPFDWGHLRREVTRLVEAGYEEDLAAEALYRANGTAHAANEYCKAHQAGVAGPRNPIPAEDAYTPSSVEPSNQENRADAEASTAESMSIDYALQLENIGAEVAEEPADDDDDDSSQATEDNDDTGFGESASRSNGAAEQQPVDASSDDKAAEEQSNPKTELDNLRDKLRDGLIDKSLDVLRAHPSSAIDLSELIKSMVLRQKNDDDVREEVGATLANALSSLAFDDEDKAANGKSIASYAHLLALLLQEKQFFKCNVDTLREKVEEYVGFLQVPPKVSNEELPPWIPYILLVIETLLQHDFQPHECKWTPPKSDDEPITSPVFSVRELIVTTDECKEILDAVLDILPRIGKDEILATASLRVLVFLSRDTVLAKQLGEKKNLQRLFVMVKQLSILGADRLNRSKINSWIMVILRHIVEDEETTRQILRAEIKNQIDISQRGQRRDLKSYVSNLAGAALRAPDMFVDTSAEMLKLDQWVPSDCLTFRNPLALKSSSATSPAAEESENGDKASSTTAPGEDIKPSTEAGDKEMTDAPKESKWPVVENPDGVVHFLLCELLNYREVDDKDSSVPAMKDLKASESPAAAADNVPSPATTDDGSVTEGKDKKLQKPTFKSEEHPIFVYRCFLLNSLAELLMSYNRTKIEFLNFKRSAPLLGNTPVRPRSSILNYLIDLLCQDSLSVATDSLAAKKKLATAARAQSVLVALVNQTGEKPHERNKDRFEYDDDPDLLFVRKFVLDTILKAYERASTPDESLDLRYARMQSLAELMCQIIGDRDKDHGPPRPPSLLGPHAYAQLRRMMYEKGYLDKLTSSIAEIDLKFPGVRRVIKYILRVLKVLTDTAKELSLSNVIQVPSHPEHIDDEIASASSLSDLEDEREETPDLYRHSALGMLEPHDSDDDSDEDEDEDDDGYDDEDDYGDEMDYEDDGLDSHDEDNVSDEDEELGDMGPIEGLHGDPVLEVIVDEDDDDDMDDDDIDDDEDSDDDDEEMDSDDMEEEEDRVHIAVEEDDLMDDDGNPEWESASDSEEEDDEALDYDVEEPELDEDDLHHHHHHHHHHLTDGEILGTITRAVMGEPDFDPDDMDDVGDGYLDDGRDDEDDEDDEDVEDDEYFHDVEYPQLVPAMMPPALGWDTFMVHPPDFPGHGQGGRHRNRGNIFDATWTLGPGRDLGEYGYLHRSNARSGNSAGNGDDGTNPLLRRPNAGREASPHPGAHPGSVALRFRSDFFAPGRGFSDGGPIAVLHDLIAAIPQVSHVSWAGGRDRAGPLPIFTDGRRDRHEFNISSRDHRGAGHRDSATTDPQQAVSFSPMLTRERYDEEGTMLLGPLHGSRVSDRMPQLFAPRILHLLAPAAIEQKKKDDAEKAKRREERLKREEEERLKRAEEARKAEEAKAEEARRAAEAAEAAAASAAAESQRQQAPASAPSSRSASASPSTRSTDRTGANELEQGAAPQPMEGVETGAAAAAETSTTNEPTPSQNRVVTTIRGEEVDVTELGIDPDYLAALPEEFREEVIAQTVSSRRSRAREESSATGEQTEVFQEFLDALPAELRIEIIQQERQEQRRRNDEEQRRQNQSAGIVQVAADMDAASILLTLPPELRDEVLLEQGDEILDQLPPEMAAQARALAERANSPRHGIVRGSNIMTAGRPRPSIPGAPAGAAGGEQGDKVARRTVVQMLDKSGVATLLRLMFIVQQGHTRAYLFSIFADICENRQNRLEVISTLLQILQDGSTDMDAIERSFGQLSLKAKKPRDKEGNDLRTPQSLKRSLTTVTPSAAAAAAQTQTHSEISPLLIVQQCLDLLVDLSSKNLHIPWLFLTEHDIMGSSVKRTLSRKSKAKESKAQKYAINSLLSLLDREIVMESSNIMSLLADLLNRLTLPLQNLERRRKEAEEAEKAAEATAEEDKKKTEEGTGSAPPAAAGEGQASGASDSKPTEAGSSTLQEKKAEEPSKPKPRTMQIPVIPHYNLTLVIKIFVARECSSKTFQNTIAAIKNLSAIPGAKAVFGQELVKQAQALSKNIVADLDELLPQITKATSGTEIQGVALAKFSPGASEQNKLLRVLTALDHLFETKKAGGEDQSGATSRETEKQDLISTLYHHPTFSTMWEKLSACLVAIRQRENMLNVATILLPLIESLMAVCKNTATNAPPQPSTQSQVGKDMVLSSPPPESPMAGLFFTFTEEHRRILNELVRNNPKLMQGPFKLLVKNPKVLEFDNKRNYFSRSVHARTNAHGRTSYQPLQLSVRREHVFHDSFKSLYFKSGDEMKYGKLNIRFHGEEGVDAGGVTREWFQVLSRQMFDPNYALFIPVSSDRTTFHPNKLSGINDEHLRFFKFIGRIIGKALYEGRLLDCYFSRAVYKRILGKSVSVKDMESFDPDYYKSLVWMLDNDITEIITETFSLEDDEFGRTNTVDLIPNGRNIPVTEENKHEYVRLVVEHKLLNSVKDQMEHFLKGFHDIIPADLISIFNEQELELLISGLPDIDVDDWKSNTEYHNYTASSPQIQWFWRAVRSFDKEERAKLLQFVTGTSKVPLNGFKELEGMNGINRFNIHRDYGNKTRLPSSHTCFNQLDLPEYESYDMLRKQLLKAITAGSDYFGFA